MEHCRPGRGYRRRSERMIVASMGIDKDVGNGATGLTDRERAGLAETAATRAGRQRAWVLGVFLVFLVGATGLPAALAEDGVDAPGLALLALPALVTVIILVAFYVRRNRNQQWPLALGADRATRAAVRHAIRQGQTSDGRIDALVRDLQEYRAGHRRSVLAPAAVVAAANLIVIVAVQHLALRIVLAFGLVLVLAAAWVAHRDYRRLTAYRGLSPSP